MSLHSSPKVKQCFAVGCGARIAREMLMCSSHWNLVSRSTQNEVYRTYQKLAHGGSLRDYVAATRRAQLEAAREQGMPNELLDILAADLKTLEPTKKASPLELVKP